MDRVRGLELFAGGSDDVDPLENTRAKSWCEKYVISNLRIFKHKYGYGYVQSKLPSGMIRARVHWGN